MMKRRTFFKQLFLAILAIWLRSYQRLFAETKENIPSDHFNDASFFNPGHPHSTKNFWDVLKWRLTSNREAWKERPSAFEDHPPERVGGKNLRVSFVGHATLLLQTAGLNILVDPIWSERASPLSFIGPKRITPPGIPFDRLPNIDVVLITHNHYDHLSLDSILALWGNHRPRIIAPLKNAAIIHADYPDIQVEELDWEEQVPLSSAVDLIMQPAFHWSARGMFDRNKSLWCAYVLQTPAGNLYLAGDTGFNQGRHIDKTAKKFAPFKFAALPIGAYEPRWFMREQHINPAEAVQVAQLLQAQAVLGIHLQTFQLGDEGFDQPLDDLQIALEEYQFPPSRFSVLQPGQFLEWS